MFRHAMAQNLWKKMLAVGAAGMMFASSCSSTETQAILVGLDVAGRIIASQQSQTSSDDISFGDWLADEFGGL